MIRNQCAVARFSFSARLRWRYRKPGGQAPPTWSISGTITSGTLATVNLSGTTSASTVADAGGNYVLTGLVDGTYTVSPYKSGSSFTPPSQVVTVNGASVAGRSGGG
jgi:hypothetical protein